MKLWAVTSQNCLKMSDIHVKRFHQQCTFSPLFLWIKPTWASRTGVSIFSIFGKPFDRLGFQGPEFLFFLFSAIQSISMPSTPLLAKVLSPCNVSHHDEEDFQFKFLTHWAGWFFWFVFLVTRRDLVNMSKKLQGQRLSCS